jgi:IS5 family transposase
MIRMLNIGYCFAIRSERRLCEEVDLNLAYRWFCRLGLDGKVPDHSTFSRNRHGRFRQSDVLRHVFETVVRRCMEEGLVGGEGFAVDASLIQALTGQAALETVGEGGARTIPLVVHMTLSFILPFALAFVAIGCVASVATKQAQGQDRPQTVEDFYRGKQVRGISTGGASEPFTSTPACTRPTDPSLSAPKVRTSLVVQPVTSPPSSVCP